MQYLPLYDFLEDLRKYGFRITADTHLKVQELLASINPHEVNYNDLKFIICPIVAINPDQQERFYQLYDQSFFLKFDLGINENIPDTSDAISNKDIIIVSRTSNRNWFYRLLGALNRPVIIGIVITIITILFFYLLSLNNFWAGNIEPILLDTLDIPDFTVIPDSLQIQPSEFDTLEVNPSLQNNNVQEVDSNFYQPYVWIFFMVLLILLVFYELYLLNRKKIIAKHKHELRPPYIWEPEFEEGFNITMKYNFYLAAQQFRQRLLGEVQQLNIANTIQSTINNAGYFTPVYQSGSRPSEYLILIDQSSWQNHQSRFFEYVAQLLSKNEINVDRYFFKNDPRLCWNDETGKRYHIEDLHSKYPNHRLLIFSEGTSFINPLDGNPEIWTELLESWVTRVLLTPKPSASWAYHELKLSEVMQVLPANTEGLLETITYAENLTTQSLGHWKRNRREEGILLEGSPEEVIERLKDHLKEPVFNWLACCAVYPQLFWDLTLYLGEVLFPNKQLLQEENILALTRLTWFQDSFIPQEMRLALKAELSEELVQNTRTAIQELLAQKEPEVKTFAQNTHRLHMAINELLIKETPPERKRELKQNINLLTEVEEMTDFTALEIKTASNPRLDFILPSELKKYFTQISFSYLIALRFGVLLLLGTGFFFFEDYVGTFINQAFFSENALEIWGTLAFGFSTLFLLSVGLEEIESMLCWMLLGIAYSYFLFYIEVQFCIYFISLIFMVYFTQIGGFLTRKWQGMIAKALYPITLALLFVPILFILEELAFFEVIDFQGYVLTIIGSILLINTIRILYQSNIYNLIQGSSYWGILMAIYWWEISASLFIVLIPRIYKIINPYLLISWGIISLASLIFINIKRRHYNDWADALYWLGGSISFLVIALSVYGMLFK